MMFTSGLAWTRAELTRERVFIIPSIIMLAAFYRAKKMYFKQCSGSVIFSYRFDSGS
jgi:hypothetical protein